MKFNLINNRKIVTILLTGIVLINVGCSKKVEEDKNDKIVIYEIKEDDKSFNETDKYDQQFINKEETIINYFNSENENIDKILKNEKFEAAKIRSKEIFVNLVDFIFYDAEINGITYKELSIETKYKLNEILISIDLKIDNKFPNYKETIKDSADKSYSFISEKINNTKKILEEQIINDIGVEKYENIKEKSKDKINDIKENSKNIYENTKEKVKSIYEGWK